MTKILSVNRERERERESSLRPKIFIKFLLTFLFFITIFFAIHSSASAATRYVNADSSGAASNPTRAFNDPSYTANDSYQTFTAAYTAASAGDTIEFSGGTSGKSYAGHSSIIAKQLTIQGSSIAGFNGTVTITYNASTGYTLGANADGIILKRLTFSGSNTNIPLAIYKNNITVTDVVLKDAGGDNYSLSFSTTAGYTTTLTNLIIYGNTTGRGINMNADSGTANFFNCTVNGVSNVAVLIRTGAVANFTNCSFTADGTIVSNMFYFSSGGTINTTNSFIQGTINYPQTVASGGPVTWNSTNDIIDGFPYYKATQANLGYLAFSTDDRYNINYCLTNANYAMATYGIPITCYISNTQDLSASDKTKLQTLYKQGDEIGLHTRHHTTLNIAYPFTVTYSGAGTSMAFVVSGSGTALSVTGTADTHGPIDLTNTSYDTVGELCTTIGTWTNFTCALSTSTYGETSTSILSNSLKDVSTNLSGATQIPYDDDAGPNNRLYKEEITNSINDLESALHEDSACASYVVKTIAFPYNEANDATLTWIQANTSLIGARANNTSTAVVLQQKYLGSIDIFNAYVPPVSTFLKGDGTQAVIEKSARLMATYASNGFFTGMLHHNVSEMTSQQWIWMLDEIVKYRTAYNLNINSFANLFNEIRTSGLWTNSSGSIWTRTFTGSDDFRLRYNSPLINTGTTVAGRTTDILGNPIVGTPDMGAYEFQAPTAPTSLAQYKSDGTTTISSGAFTNETSVVLKFNMASINASDSLTPEVEIQPIGTSFTDTVTSSGTAVAYSDTAVLGTVNVTGLTDGVTYHWQARISNIAGSSSWVAMGGNPDFGIDTSAPTPNPPIITTSNLSQTSITWTLSTGTDAGSDLNTTPYGFSTTSGGPYTFQATPSLTEDTFSCSTSHTIYGVLKDALDNQSSEGSATLTTSACASKTGSYAKKTVLASTTTPVITSVSTNPSTNSGQTTSTPEGKQASYNFGTTTLKNGSRGEAVKELQRFLNIQLNSHLVIDGILGPKTLSATKIWQQANGLVADGLVGPLTKGKMLGEK